MLRSCTLSGSTVCRYQDQDKGIDLWPNSTAALIKSELPGNTSWTSALYQHMELGVQTLYKRGYLPIMETVFVGMQPEITGGFFVSKLQWKLLSKSYINTQLT